MPRATFSKSVLARILEMSPDPAYVLDDRRRCVFANQGLLDWLDISAETLSNQVCDYHSQSPWGALCPPPYVFEKGRAAVARIHRPIANPLDSSSDSREMQFVPVANGAAGLLAVFCFALCQRVDAGEDRADPSFGDSPERLHEFLAEFRQHQAERYHMDRLVGESAANRRVRDQVRVAIQSDGRVLVTGPVGSGREHVVRTIHVGRQLEESAGLVPLACPLFDAQMLRTTLTSFIQQCAELETAQPPSLLLSEVDQLPADAQAELEGFLAIDELGLRTLATARTSLLKLAQAGIFRRDLAFALSPIEIQLQELSTRTKDIPPLVQLFVERSNAEGGMQRVGFAADAMEQLVAYPWPGELDELEKVVTACARSAAGATIQAVELPQKIRLGLDAMIHPPISPVTIDLPSVLEDVERELIRHALRETKQNKAEAARRLGISRNKLLRRISYLGMEA